MGAFDKKYDENGCEIRFVNPLLRRKYDRIIQDEMSKAELYQIGQKVQEVENATLCGAHGAIGDRLSLLLPSKVAEACVRNAAGRGRAALNKIILDLMLREHKGDKPNPTLEIRHEIKGRLVERLFNRCEGSIKSLRGEQDPAIGAEQYEYYVFATSRSRMNELYRNKKFEVRSVYKDYMQRKPIPNEKGRYCVAKGKYIVFQDVLGAEDMGGLIYGSEPPYEVMSMENNAHAMFTKPPANDKATKEEKDWTLYWWKANIGVKPIEGNHYIVKAQRAATESR